MAEQEAVNFKVVGSTPTRGAPHLIFLISSYLLILLYLQHPNFIPGLGFSMCCSSIIKYMTTFLLHGGETSRDNSQNDYFFKQFTALVNKNSVKILLCYLSQEKAKWDKLIQRDKPKINNKTNKKVSFDIAESAEDLLSKIEENDVLYVAGGQPDLLEPYFNQLKGLREKLEDKVYIGSSMGTYMVSESYFTIQDEITHHGMGILPIQTICHWDQIEDREHKLSLLKENSKSMVLVLNECQSVEIYQ